MCAVQSDGVADGWLRWVVTAYWCLAASQVVVVYVGPAQASMLFISGLVGWFSWLRCVDAVECSTGDLLCVHPGVQPPANIPGISRYLELKNMARKKKEDQKQIEEKVRDSLVMPA